jgi:hypothetical protein
VVVAQDKRKEWTPMLHKLSESFLRWPDWIKMLVLIGLITLSLTVTVLLMNSLIERLNLSF